MIKLYIYFNALLIDVKAQHKEGLKAEAGKKIFTTSTPEKFLSDPNAQIILSHGFCVRNFRTFSIKSFNSLVGQILLSHLNGGLGSKTCPIPNRKRIERGFGRSLNSKSCFPMFHHRSCIRSFVLNISCEYLTTYLACPPQTDALFYEDFLPDLTIHPESSPIFHSHIFSATLSDQVPQCP